MTDVTPYFIAERFIGVAEWEGSLDNPLIMAMLKLDTSWPQHDEVSWCSAFVNFPFWMLRLSRSKSLMARSWLSVGIPIDVHDAKPGYDVVVFNRGGSNRPEDPGPGHVGFFSALLEGSYIYTLGGNQDNKVGLSKFPLKSLLGVRRILT